MKEILILSGKGGVGKTSIAAGLISLFPQVAVADCDVDAANMHLLLDHKNTKEEEFYSGYVAEVTPACNGCEKCIELCRYDAIVPSDSKVTIDPLACEGCGVCADHCPEEAIVLNDRFSGHLFEAEASTGPFVHAHLGAGGENSGKLVSSVRKRAKLIAKEKGLDLLISDGPPGIGCPVIASMGGVNGVVVVVEPSKSSIHDMERVLTLCKHFSIKPLVVINKHDLNPRLTEEITTRINDLMIPILGKIPMDKAFYEAQIQGVPITELENSLGAQEIKKIFENLKSEIEQL